MTGEEAGKVMAILNAGFPREAVEPETLAVWMAEMIELQHKPARSAARTVIRNGERFPTFHEFKVAYRAAATRLAPPAILAAPESTEMTIDAREWIDRNIPGMLRSMDDLPVSESMKPRPVWERFERRRRMEPLLPPTEAEIHDAILVMAEDPWKGDVEVNRAIRDLALEAERIFVEASS